MTVSAGRLRLTGELDFEARAEFIAAARVAIASTDTNVELDCSAVKVVGTCRSTTR